MFSYLDAIINYFHTQWDPKFFMHWPKTTTRNTLDMANKNEETILGESVELSGATNSHARPTEMKSNSEYIHIRRVVG